MNKTTSQSITKPNIKKILIAPDSFKGSLSAAKFCDIAKRAILSVDKNIVIDTLPLADGGEGSVDALLALPLVEKINCQSQDALGREICASYAYFPKTQSSFIESASAVGLTLLTEAERNPFIASSYGLGLIIKDAINKGAKNISIGLGGTATNDGGIGCLQALGFKFLDKQGSEISGNNSGLATLEKMISGDTKFTVINFTDINITIACDVTNPLLGENGATYVYAKQKGAKNNDLPVLENNLAIFANAVNTQLGIDIANVAGAGAAGGLGAGLLLLGAKLQPGFTVIAKLLGLEAMLIKNQYDLIITGEGQLNSQSQFGKVPVALATLANKHGQQVIAICGSVDISDEEVKAFGLKGAFAIRGEEMRLDYAIEHAEELLFDCVGDVVRERIER